METIFESSGDITVQTLVTCSSFSRFVTVAVKDVSAGLTAAVFI